MEMEVDVEEPPPPPPPQPQAVFSDEACRLCDAKTETMHSVFDKTDEGGQQIMHLMKECLPIIVFRTDPLSKQICEDCFVKLRAYRDFKKNSVDVANKHIQQLKDEDNGSNKNVQLYLSIEAAEPASIDQSTSTDNLTVLCSNCKSGFHIANNLDNSEMELCTDLHKAIADSMSNNRVQTSDSEKVLRSRGRRSQAFYHELDDSLCSSSLTEFTNTEDTGSQIMEEYHSDMESCDSERFRAAKRRKLNPKHEMIVEKDIDTYKELYKDQTELRYYPLSLMNLSLNVINARIVPEYEPEQDFYIKDSEPECRYCREKFKNSKLLALHEVKHVNIELGEKVDNPVPWHESRDDADVRNKWLGSFDDADDDDDEGGEDDMLEMVSAVDFADCEVEEEDQQEEAQSLLIPIGTSEPLENEAGEIVLVMTKPFVNGISLNEYTKEERKAFYKTMKIGKLNKKFCSLCRYTFKDNWAMESHYFSSACYFTCRYCGMRFNKQRHIFDEHVLEHEEKGDLISTKIYCASKLSNFMPRVIHLDKANEVLAQHEREDHQKQSIPIRPKPQIIGPRRDMYPNVKIKEEKEDTPPPLVPQMTMSSSSSHQGGGGGNKSANQAYFCRKCYKVFFKLDEFNVHSKNCDYNQFPTNSNRNSTSTNVNSNNGNATNNNRSTNGELSPAGRPVRHCVQRAGAYKDELYIPEPPKEVPSPQSQQSFVCFICNTPFPTIYSRNSHMRIHKGETGTTLQQRKQSYQANHNNTPRPSQPPPQRYQPKPLVHQQIIKQEPLEPEVQIHETEQSFSSNSIGSVSITPISKNPNQKATINPNIMKLVQNNPHLTIKANTERPTQQQSPHTPNIANANMYNNSPNDSDKTYKCSSCWEAFTNKSHLYFHKKNQCEGSKYPCPFCKKRFGTEAAYSSHIFYSHPE